MGTNGVKIESVSKNYGQVEALQDISLDIRPGELFGLIVPTGQEDHLVPYSDDFIAGG